MSPLSLLTFLPLKTAANRAIQDSCEAQWQEAPISRLPSSINFDPSLAKDQAKRGSSDVGYSDEDIDEDYNATGSVARSKARNSS
jgi:hypothetical protein